MDCTEYLLGQIYLGGSETKIRNKNQAKTVLSKPYHCRKNRIIFAKIAKLL
jgi:hypothetical protein